jgi:RNA polymerase-interacting CarD/CdnL/TRCF family regulator
MVTKGIARQREEPEMSKKVTFKKGDWIVHAYYGVGQVLAVDRKTIEGVQMKYFRVKTKSMTYWLPVNNSDVEHIRPVASKNLFTRSLKIIQKKPHKMANDYRSREKQISEAFAECSIKTLAALIRDLYGRRARGKINAREGEILARAKSLFVNEYVIVADTDPEDARTILEKALVQSVASFK